jgi:hypothetical protein
MPRLLGSGDLFGSLWRDLLWIAVFIVSVAAWFSLRRIPGWLRAVRAASWPMTEGIIEHGSVTSFAEQSLGELAYSYSVEGERYSGYFQQQFAQEQDAWDYIHALKRQAVFVRYKPGTPELSAIRIGDQSPVFATRTPLPGRLVRSSIVHLIGVSDWRSLSLLGAKYWPMSKGKVEYATVTRKREHHLFYMAYYVCEVSYSYSVAGEYYAGQFEKLYFREDTARDVAENWRGKELFVRYRQEAPNVSTVRKQDQTTLHSA